MKKILFLFEGKKADWIFISVILLFSLFLYLLPGGVKKTEEARTVSAVVVQTDDSSLMQHGLLPYGSQHLTVKLLEGKGKGKLFPAGNELRGQLELDKIFKKGDILTVAAAENDIPGKTVLQAKDYHRYPILMVLFFAFALLLILFGAWTGVKALFSFLFSCLVIFKLVIPLTLLGYNANMIIFASVVLLTGVILFLVGGCTCKALAAFTGAISGIFAGLAMAHIFSHLLHINGASMPFVQTLLYSGQENLNMQDIFTGCLILAGSGAIMDLAMDIAAAVEEVAFRNPDLSGKELTLSGLRIGRSVVGTMTTTLLLAYSGGFLTLLMMFTLQGTSFMDIINNPVVAAEIVKTLIGSFSLVLVAPLTAVASGYIFSRKRKI